MAINFLVSADFERRRVRDADETIARLDTHRRDDAAATFELEHVLAGDRDLFFAHAPTGRANVFFAHTPTGRAAVTEVEHDRTGHEGGASSLITVLERGDHDGAAPMACLGLSAWGSSGAGRFTAPSAFS